MADAETFAHLGDDGPPFRVHASSLTISPPGPWEDGDCANVKVADLAYGGTLSVTLEAERVPDLLALFFCQLDDHDHDGRTCVPSWIRLGED